MKQETLKDSSVSEMFSPETWPDDAQNRFQIEPLTGHFYRSVPSLEYLDWKIEKIERGYAQTRLPLNVESSNQYITQQAALMLLAADYTGGIALATLFKETPIIGFHPQKTGHGAYLWGAAATIKWLRPSTTDLLLSSRIHVRHWDEIARSFERGDEVNFKARIKMTNESGRLVAVSEFNYWARSSSSLRATSRSINAPHHMLIHKLCTSARLIAGLRSWIIDPANTAGGQLDPYAERAAGKQGMAMASKFSTDTPQLGELVRARTLACDEELIAFSRQHPDYVVINVGCGLDTRAWRMQGIGNPRFVEIDLQVMLDERAAVLPPIEQSAYPITRGPFDILFDDLGEKLRELDVPADLPRFFIWEGGSMYFEAKELERLVDMMRGQMCDRSVLWVDFVTETAVMDRSGHPAVQSFIENMRVIGEPFVWGADDASAFSDMGFSVTRSRSAADVTGSADVVMQHYLFATCTR